MPGIVEHRLGNHHTAQQANHLEARQGDDRDHGVGLGMFVDHILFLSSPWRGPW